MKRINRKNTVFIIFFLLIGINIPFKLSYNENITEFKYDIIAPTKEVTKYRNITMKRTESKYHKIQKSRGVIKFKNESKSFLERFFPYIF